GRLESADDQLVARPVSECSRERRERAGVAGDLYRPCRQRAERLLVPERGGGEAAEREQAEVVRVSEHRDRPPELRGGRRVAAGDERGEAVEEEIGGRCLRS